jgi:hypothetical protein
VIIHCAAERKVEAVEKNFDGTMKLNVDATKNLAEICGKKKKMFFFKFFHNLFLIFSKIRDIFCLYKHRLCI